MRPVGACGGWQVVGHNVPWRLAGDVRHWCAAIEPVPAARWRAIERLTSRPPEGRWEAIAEPLSWLFGSRLDEEVAAAWRRMEASQEGAA